MDPSFNTNTVSYTVFVPNSVSSIYVDAVPADIKAIVIPSSPNPVELEPGQVKTITITVSAESGNTKQYIIRATRLTATQTDATLRTLTYNGVTVPGFSPTGDTEYTFTVPYATESVTLAATLVNTAGEVILPTPNPVELVPGEEKTITVTGKAASGDTKDYTIKVTRLHASANLSSITINGVQVPGFSPTGSSYTITVPYAGNETITVAATGNAEGSTLDYSIDPDSPVALVAGVEKTITVKGKSVSGAIKEYTLIVTRALPSDNAKLSSLSISPWALSPPFAPDTLEYTASVANGITSLTVSASKQDPLAAAPTLPTNPVSLNVGANTIQVTVHAEDPAIAQTYKIVVTRRPEDLNNAKLATLSVNGVPVPGFDPDIGGPYAVNAAYRIDTITLAAQTEEEKTGVTLSGDTLDTAHPFASEVSEGGTKTFTVNSAKGTGTKTYTIVVTRLPASTINTLSSITVSAGTLTPKFTSTGNFYSVEIPYLTPNVTVNAVKTNAEATVVLSVSNGLAITNGVVTLNASTPYPFTVTATVTPESLGAPERYYIEFRQQGQLSVTITQPDEVIDLATDIGNNLSIAGGGYITVTADISGISNFEWYVDGTSIGQGFDNFNGTYSVNITAASVGVGTHTVLLQFYKDEIYYGSEVSFKVGK
ncbi:cadherin-like beta sandwich domain-containing protein [Treponema primitia]|uniref:cadherin-like beta sandwich domain-containing protein n=1 Tax=Treponema primitia TaxID=88058 RepID=UPI001FE014B4